MNLALALPVVFAFNAMIHLLQTVRTRITCRGSSPG